MAKARRPPENEAGFGNAAHLLIAALEGVPAELHPKPPFHGGGPQPKIDAAGYVRAVLWLADRAAPFVSADDRADFDRMVKLAKKQVKLGRGDLSQAPQLIAASRTKSSKVPLKIAIWTCHEAHNWIARPIYAGGAARPAARQLAGLISKKQGNAAASEFVGEVDAMCVHLEATYMLANHDLVPSSAAARTTWRGLTRDKATAWILELANGQLALISKIGARWKLTEGDRKFVLAHVADDQLDGAAAATAD